MPFYFIIIQYLLINLPYLTLIQKDISKVPYFSSMKDLLERLKEDSTPKKEDCPIPSVIFVDEELTDFNLESFTEAKKVRKSYL